MNSNNRLSKAQALHQRGDLARARREYQAILKTRPAIFDALVCLAALELQLDNLDEAQRLIRRAIEIRPQSAEAHLCLGNVLHAQRQFEPSLVSYDHAIAANPRLVQAHVNRGNVLVDLERHAEALESYDRALTIHPANPEALNYRGNALHMLGRYEEAIASYDRALALAPQYSDALNSRGNALRALGRNGAALADYEQALRIEPGFVDALGNAAGLLRNLRRYAEAHSLYDRILTADSGNLDAVFGQAMLWHVEGRYERAIQEFERLQASGYAGSGHLQSTLLSARMNCCDWRNHDEDARRIIADVRAGKNASLPFSFMSLGSTPRDQLDCASVWARTLTPASQSRAWEGGRHRNPRIRVAYLSSDFCDHPVGWLVADLIERHDGNRFETMGISLGAPSQDPVQSRLRISLDHFVDAYTMSHRDVADRIRAFEADIVVDLNGYTQGCRPEILALRPAPIQVNYLGYPGTMGVGFIDYIVADRHALPVTDQDAYAEQVVRLPDSFMVYGNTTAISDRIPTREQAGLPQQGFIFCAFNRAQKITPLIFALWMRLMRRVEDSVLWLSDNGEVVRRNLRAAATEQGVAPGRLVFASRVSDKKDHLARLGLAGLFLDTLPYNAHATAADALWAGLPVLTCTGTTFAGRVATSLLHAVGLPELATPSLEDYERLAIELARDPQRLGDLKARLAGNRQTQPLFDTDRFRRHIEAAYTTMWERWQRGEAPASFAVPALDAREHSRLG